MTPPARRIHIFGASGTGTSTLARALATALGTQAFDTDDFYWHPTDPPFRSKREVGERLSLMEAVFLPRRDWILAGSMYSWGGPVLKRLTHIVFVTLPAEERLRRLVRREERRYGPGGADPAFLDWAARYDDPTFDGRSRHAHEAFLATVPIPVLRIDATPPRDAVLAATRDALAGAGTRAEPAGTR